MQRCLTTKAGFAFTAQTTEGMTMTEGSDYNPTIPTKAMWVMIDTAEPMTAREITERLPNRYESVAGALVKLFKAGVLIRQIRVEGETAPYPYEYVPNPDYEPDPSEGGDDDE